MKQETSTLIAQLSAQALPTPTLRSPWVFSLASLCIFCVYAFISMQIQGLRPDLAQQLTRLYFMAELVLLAAIFVSSLVAAIMSMYPDRSQPSLYFRAPLFLSLIFLCLTCAGMLLSEDGLKSIPHHHLHDFECTLCIALIALFPAALLFILLRRGACVLPQRSGSFCVLTATSIGCFLLRLVEQNDSELHLLLWHYLPTFVFSAAGAWIGHRFLRWA